MLGPALVRTRGRSVAEDTKHAFRPPAAGNAENMSEARTTPRERSEAHAGLEEDTSVVIVSSWIPVHPSLRFIHATIASLDHLKGLSPTAPLVIAVDGPPPSLNATQREQLRRYVANLRSEYGQTSRVRILDAKDWLHIAGNTRRALDVVATKYLYVVEHDFPFCEEVNHTALVRTFEEYHPEHLKTVRFGQRRNGVESQHPYVENGGCWDADTAVPRNVNGIRLTKTSLWSNK